MKYYYLVASFPLMVIGDPPPFSPEEFRLRCSTLLDEQDLRELDLVLEGRVDEGTSTFSRQWRQVETQLRNAVALTRAEKAGVESKLYVRDQRGFSVFIEESVTDAYAKSDPLGREGAIDKCRWQLLDDIARQDEYGLAGVLAFAVKLQIVSRWATLNDEGGRKRFEELVAAVRGEEREDLEETKTEAVMSEAET